MDGGRRKPYCTVWPRLTADDETTLIDVVPFDDGETCRIGDDQDSNSSEDETNKVLDIHILLDY